MKKLLLLLALLLICEGMMCETQQTGAHTYSRIERTIK